MTLARHQFRDWLTAIARGAASVFMLCPPPINDEEVLARDMDTLARDFEDVMRWPSA